MGRKPRSPIQTDIAESTPAGGNDGEGNPIDADGRTGAFDGQPVHGFNGVQFAPNNKGAFWFLSNNGFGTQENSTDYLLRIYQVDPNFAAIEEGDRSVDIETFIQFKDPNNILEAGLDFDPSNNLIFSGEGDDLIDLSPGEGNNRAYGGSGSDIFILGSENRIFAGDGDDRLFVLSGGNNTIYGNSGVDQFWIANGEYPDAVKKM